MSAYSVGATTNSQGRTISGDLDLYNLKVAETGDPGDPWTNRIARYYPSKGRKGKGQGKVFNKTPVLGDLLSDPHFSVLAAHLTGKGINLRTPVELHKGSSSKKIVIGPDAYLLSNGRIHHRTRGRNNPAQGA